MNYILPALQRYDWGSHTFIQNFLKIHETGALAEAWYSAHPKAPSLVDNRYLNHAISENPVYWLGKEKTELPFLLKILAAREALSIQVHPSKHQAEIGFERENALKIPLDAPNRNYRDRNHKPEMILALTPFHALCGIREYPEIVEIFTYFGLNNLFESFTDFAQGPDSEGFTFLYREILQRKPLPGLADHLCNLPKKDKWQDELIWSKKLLQLYPQDPSVLSPMFLNLICLQPFEAIFLEAGIIHAYLEGAGIEIMASGDNVLRAGLSPKHIDVEELLGVMRNEPYKAQIISSGDSYGDIVHYQVPVDDFLLSRIRLNGEFSLPRQKGARIVLALEGECQMICEEEILHLKQGDAAIIPAAQQDVDLKGKADLVMACSALA
ncbi:MAG: mannose-6-phosphate isomerase, class I [Candidatus Cloacimonetes bacterium]|nr:mannose-6-phosphate isomerase, class I [Candidatus Cloacimonadota bacterium]MDD4560687.1 mannose-6-phosphate isomerase, class I [Candidatus Cloacimonadota bacterium]